jgi:chitin synthase
MFSMVTYMNPFAGPSFNPNPTDDDLLNSLQNYLNMQDLMMVMKKYAMHLFHLLILTVCRTAREEIMAKFPKADLT